VATATAVSNSALFSEKRVAVLGAGKMGGIILRALLNEGFITPDRACATVLYPHEVEAVTKNFKIAVGQDNAAAVRGADIVLLSVKPQQVKEVLEGVRGVVRTDQLFISVAASVPTAFMERALAAKVPVVRAMPNTPCFIRRGMTALCKGAYADDRHVALAKALFDTIGRAVVLDEKYMDAVTGLSSSGPAYIYVIIESLAEAGVKVGLSRDLATLLAAQTTLGAASMVLETGDHPALLKDAVTTPAGCTIDGLLELEEGKLRVTLIKAVVKAVHRAKELMFS
jgi:pyrroline-5-carboxylate reductase